MKYAEHPRLLGVVLDRRLTFTPQVDQVVARATKKMGLLRAVASSRWGWRKEDLRRVFIAHIRNVLTFASSSWQPWLSTSNINRLEVVQNRCLRLITTQARSTPLEALRAEAGVPSLRSTIEANCLISHEKALRLCGDHPRRVAALSTARTRLKRADFVRRARQLSSKVPHLEEQPRDEIRLSVVPPWDRGIRPGTVFPHAGRRVW